MYVTEKIGDEYRNWIEGDEILIQASTGSGKSYFILHVLLKWAISQNRKILYLVNRSVLKKQLEEGLYSDISNEIYEEFGYRLIIENYVTVRTYQSIEKNLNEKNNYALRYNIEELKTYSYVVYDECHYFYSDSNFNTNTQLSFDCLRDIFLPRFKFLFLQQWKI